MLPSRWPGIRECADWVMSVESSSACAPVMLSSAETSPLMS
jgi:hypothetical protein